MSTLSVDAVKEAFDGFTEEAATDGAQSKIHKLFYFLVGEGVFISHKSTPTGRLRLF